MKESFGSSANSSNHKINLSGFGIFIKNHFSWKMISIKQRFKQNKIGNWHPPTKHELSHSTLKISNRKAISSGLYKLTRNFMYSNKH